MLPSLSAQLTVFTDAAMGGLWDLRLPMTNGGQAGAAES